MYEMKDSTYNVEIYRSNAPPNGNGGSQWKNYMNQCIQDNRSDNSTFRKKEEESARDVAEEGVLDDLSPRCMEEERLQEINEENRLDNSTFRINEEEHPQDVDEEKKQDSKSM